MQNKCLTSLAPLHRESEDFGPDGSRGTKARRISSDEVEANIYNYYSYVSCPMQGFRDWLLTDSGCASLQSLGLSCTNKTTKREECVQWVNHWSKDNFLFRRKALVLIACSSFEGYRGELLRTVPSRKGAFRPSFYRNDVRSRCRCRHTKGKLPILASSFYVFFAR